MNGNALRTVRRRLPAPFDRQRSFSTLVGRSESMLSKYENDRRPIPPEVASLATLFHVLADRFPVATVSDFLVPAFAAAEDAARAIEATA